MTMRAATLDDVPTLAKILGDWFESTPFVPRLHTPQEDTRFVSDMIETQDVVVNDGQAVIGFIARNGAQISQLYVAENTRNQGMGGRLLDTMKEGSTGLWLWCFQANEGARRFYECHGFSIDTMTDGRKTEEQVPDVRYVWGQQQ